MRKSSAANSAASSPPVPARTSRMAFFSSASSLGRSSVLTCSSRIGSRLFTVSSSTSASFFISASPPPASSSSDWRSTSAWRKAVMPSTRGVSSLYSLASLANSPVRAGSAMAALNSAWRATRRSSLASNGVLSAISASERREAILERGQRHVFLRAGIEVANGGLAAFQLVLAEDHRRTRHDLIGAPHALLQIARIGEIDRETGAPQLLRQRQCALLAVVADGHQRNRPQRRRGLGDHQRQSFDARRPADARRFGTTHHAHQAIVTAAGEHCALRSELGGDEFEGGVRVVIEATHQTRVERVFDAKGVEPVADAAKEFARCRRQIVLEMRCSGAQGDIGRVLRIENAQRIAFETLAAVLRQFVRMLREVFDQRVAIEATAFRVAQCIEMQRGALQHAERGENVGAERDHLDVALRLLDADQLDTDLVELAEAALLRPF